MPPFFSVNHRAGSSTSFPFPLSRFSCQLRMCRSHAAVAGPARPDFIRYFPLPCAVCERKQENPRGNGIDADQPDERQCACAREEEYEYAEYDRDDSIENQQCLAMYDFAQTDSHGYIDDAARE